MHAGCLVGLADGPGDLVWCLVTAGQEQDFRPCCHVLLLLYDSMHASKCVLLHALYGLERIAGSPRLCNLDNLKAHGIYLCDLPLWDMGADFVLMAEQRQVRGAHSQGGRWCVHGDGLTWRTCWVVMLQTLQATACSIRAVRLLSAVFRDVLTALATSRHGATGAANS